MCIVYKDTNISETRSKRSRLVDWIVIWIFIGEYIGNERHDSNLALISYWFTCQRLIYKCWRLQSATCFIADTCNKINGWIITLVAHYNSPRGKSPALHEVRFNPHQVRLNQALENSKTFNFPILCVFRVFPRFCNVRFNFTWCGSNVTLCQIIISFAYCVIKISQKFRLEPVLKQLGRS